MYGIYVLGEGSIWGGGKGEGSTGVCWTEVKAGESLESGISSEAKLESQ